MAEAPLSATEAALENQPLGALQIRVATLCTLVQICDGYGRALASWRAPCRPGRSATASGASRCCSRA